LREETCWGALLTWSDLQQEKHEIDSRGQAKRRRDYARYFPQYWGWGVAGKAAGSREDLATAADCIYGAVARMKVCHVERPIHCERFVLPLAI